MVTEYEDKVEFNIVILDENEEIIKWLDSELVDIKETCAVDKPRQIEVTYPVTFDELNLDEGNWYDAGNKIYIPNTLGINSCLYVINNDYDLDYWKKNTVTFTAEEVLTELNYSMVGFLVQVTPAPTEEEGGTTEETEGGEGTTTPTTPTEEEQEEQEDEDEITSGQMIEKTVSNEAGFTGTQIFKYKDKIEITSEVLRQFFGYFYEITGLDALDNQKRYISPTGTMTYMSLFRLIEEQTERVFVTEYINNGNQIQRRLALRNYQNMRRVAQTELLDLNYNLDSLELNVSEENTYSAMAPEFTDNSSVVQADTSQTAIDIGANLTSTAQTPSSNVTMQQSTKSVSEVIQDWLDYEVEPRQEHPMIIQKDTAGNLVEVASWYAPFRKEKGSLAIVSERQTESNYNQVHSYNKSLTLSKCGKVSTSETIPQIIYNTLANALLNKLSPVYDLKIDVKDIQMLMGIPNLSYELYETLQVRIPNFDYFVPCRITGTVKNPHKPGENKITVETDIKSMRNLHETEIISSDMIINDTNLANIGGILQSEETGLANKLVTINIKLVQAYNDGTIGGNLSTTNKQQVATTFDPEKNTYVFSQEEIMSKIRVYLYKCETEDNYYNTHKTLNARTVTGEIVTLDRSACFCIVYGYWQNYDLNRYYTDATSDTARVTAGEFDKTFSVHLYPQSQLDQQLDMMWMITNGFWGDKRKEHIKKFTYSAFWHNQTKLTEVARAEGLCGANERYFNCLNISGTTSVPGMCVPFAAEMAFTSMYNFIKAGDIAKDIHADSTGSFPGFIYKNFDHGIYGLPDIFQKNSNAALLFRITHSGLSFDRDIKGEYQVNNDVDPAHHHFKRSTWIVSARLGNLKTNEYFKGIYSLSVTGAGNDDAHEITITGWKVVNGVKYVYVQDVNCPVFDLHHWTATFNVNDGWVRWDVLDGALCYTINHNDYMNYLGTCRSGSGISFTAAHDTAIPLSEDSVTNQPFEIDLPIEKVEIVPLDLTNATYLFKSKDVQNAINEVYKYYIEQGMRHDLDTISTNITSVIGQKHNLKMKELHGLAYSYMYYYQNNSNKEGGNIDLKYGKNEDSQKYINHFGGEYDYFTPVYPQQKGYENQYVICAALFHLGILSSPLDFFKNKLENVTFNDMIAEVNNHSTGNLTCFIRESTQNILRSALLNQSHSKFMSTIVIVYAYDTSLAQSSQYMHNRYPLLLYRLDGDTVYYCNLAGRGNSPGFNYETKAVDYNNNPWGSTTITNMLSWIEAAKENNPNSDNCLIISRYLTIGSI